MDSSAPLSFSSGSPPDIRELFSSYTYESPELNSLDDFKHCGDAINATHEEEASPAISQLSSEPPDIKNLFSSYVYESPALDSILDFRASVYDDISRTEDNDAVNNIEVTKYSDSEAEGAPRNEYRLTPAVPLGRIKSGKDEKTEDWLKCAHKSDEITNSNKLKKQIINCENNSAKYCESQKETSLNNFDKRFSFDESPILIETNSVHTGSESTKILFSLTEKFNAQCHPEETNNKVSPTRRLDSVNQMNNKHPVMILNGDNEKENCENEFAEDGFISTRKRIQSSSQRFLCASNLSINSATGSTSLKGDTTGKRKVFSETTNIQRTTVSGTTGKWKCPQRSKPNLGPPLKQLRLEKWIHQS